MAAPFGPGSWPDRLELAGERGADVSSETKKYGWTDAAVFSLVVRVDPAKAQKWLPNSLLRVRGDTARVFFAWYARRLFVVRDRKKTVFSSLNASRSKRERPLPSRVVLTFTRPP
jgi:hypothetical protein